MKSYSLAHLSDGTLLHDLSTLLAQDRSTTASLLAHLAEVDARKLYVPAGYPSMYAWCVGELKLSEDSAFKRITAGRTARRFPALYAMVAEGRLHLSGVVQLAPHLTPENIDALLAAAAGRTKAQIERLIAERFPRPDLPALLSAIDSCGPTSERTGVTTSELAPGRVNICTTQSDPADVPNPVQVRTPVPPPTRVTPLAPRRFALQVTVSQETHDKLRHAQSQLGHAIPSGDLAQVLDRALDCLIAKLEQQRFAATARPRPSGKCHAEGSRHVPAEVKRMVWQRDGGQCTFVSDSGHRCEARKFLEFDHVDPFARGGQATPTGLRLRCRAHNQLEAERTYGRNFMEHKREESRRRTAEASETKRARGTREPGARERAQGGLARAGGPRLV